MTNNAGIISLHEQEIRTESRREMNPENNTQVIHQTINGKYRIVIEQAASTKGVLGYKIEANGDSIDLVMLDIETLHLKVAKICPAPVAIESKG